MTLRMAQRITTTPLLPPNEELTGVPLERSMFDQKAEKVQQTIRDVPVIVLDNVATYYAEHDQQDWFYSDCPIWAPPFEKCLYEWNEPQQWVFDTIDQGNKRSIADVFARQGYKHYTTLAAAVRWLWLYENKFAKNAIRPDEANEILEKNPALHHSVDVSRQLLGTHKLLHPGLLSFLIYECGKKDEKASETFWTLVMTGEGLVKNHPAYKLRHRLIGNIGSVARLDVDTIAALAIKAWNFYRTKKECGNLKWSEEEDFPTIVH